MVTGLLSIPASFTLGGLVEVDNKLIFNSLVVLFTYTGLFVKYTSPTVDSLLRVSENTNCTTSSQA
jgi:hypothetical protein